ncbi:hypothetical protein GXP67_09260 [Rhodocytophaga rosea]|uniref:Uncharacterized protein n=1 Tax=Rhodocytophaga rosea TaxID=2704465 RepID=A0A6C0GGC6_9BACT|nr:hypothetical protein [Rhodocytophaga rosea]QHT66833.1 hypothetical protein GXP67_09260 [Rhodocytophaga rosea]
MTILKVMFAVAIGTYVAYELTIRNRKTLSSGHTKNNLSSTYQRTPLNLE